jgi:transcriptional regulator with XRE-family HTH domain
LETFGKLFKKIRINKGYSLSRFCSDFGMDPVFQSKIERGVVHPSSGKYLDQCLEFFGIEKSSDLYEKIHIFANKARQKDPIRLSDYEIEKRMPCFFQVWNPVIYDRLAEGIKDIIRSAWT